jgi:hypothetical protein
MAESELSELVASRSEDLSIEYKAWLDTSEHAARAKLAKHIAALSNHGGGYLVFGVNDETRAPMGETTLDRGLFSQDEIAGVIRKYLDPRPAIRVEEADYEGVRYPVVIVPPHGSRPVIAIADGPKGSNGNPIRIRAGVIYVRRVGPESVQISSPDDWNALLDRCLAHRADLTATIFRQVLARPGGPATHATKPLKAAIDSTAADFVEQTTSLVENVNLKDQWRAQIAHDAFSIIGYGLFGENGQLVELHGLRALNDRVTISMRQFAYDGWTSFLPLTLPERAPQIRTEKLLGEDRTYLEGIRLPNMGTLPGALDYWRIYEIGIAAAAESYREDVLSPQGGDVPYLTVTQILWRVHSLLTHARLVGSETPGVLQVFVHMEWRGLAGRMLRWDFDGPYATDGRIADRRFVKTIALDWTDLRNSYFESLRRVVLPVFELFEIGGSRRVFDLLTRARVSAAFARFGSGANLFDD